MKKPILHVFLISHYCEKARWALDYCGIEYEVNLLSPLKHAKTAQAIGASGSALPILQLGDGGASDIVQGSADIINWANSNTQASKILINDETLAIEKRLDDVLGVHVRRWFYSEALLDSPEIVRPIFAKGSSLLGGLVLRMAWPKVVSAMIKRMNLGVAQEAESKAIVEGELEWLESLLSDGREFLDGDTLSNADIAAASLVAPIFDPKNHPASSVLSLPTRVANTATQWSQRSFKAYLLKLYAQYR